MSKGLIIGGVLFLMLIVIGVVVYFTMGGETPTLTGSTGPTGPTSFSYVGTGDCHNDALRVGNMCRANPECDYIGQQSNGCWHLLKSGGTGKTPSDYPKALQAIGSVSETYGFVAGGPCISTDQYSSVAETCETTPGCDTIGQQSNGCWHLLRSDGTGNNLSGYPKSIMPISLM